MANKTTCCLVHRVKNKQISLVNIFLSCLVLVYRAMWKLVTNMSCLGLVAWVLPSMLQYGLIWHRTQKQHLPTLARKTDICSACVINTCYHHRNFKLVWNRDKADTNSARHGLCVEELSFLLWPHSVPTSAPGFLWASHSASLWGMWDLPMRSIPTNRAQSLFWQNLENTNELIWSRLTICYSNDIVQLLWKTIRDFLHKVSISKLP